MQSFSCAPDEIVLDLDATDDPLHGVQEDRFFHGYYKSYCYPPLYIFSGDHLLCALLRPSNIYAPAGALDEVKRIVTQVRDYRLEVKILIRGDAGFCRDGLMSWCKENEVDFLFGMAKNNRLKSAIELEEMILVLANKSSSLISAFDY